MVKGNTRIVIVAVIAVIAVIALIVAGWIAAVVLFKAGEGSAPPRTLPATTSAQG